MIKIVVLYRVVANAGTDQQFGIRDRLAAFFNAYRQIGNIAVGTKNKGLFYLDAVCVRQRKFDLLFLARRQASIDSPGSEI